MEKAKWFEAGVKPPVKGVYEVDDADARLLMFAYWDGKQFGYRAHFAKDAFDCRKAFTNLPRLTRWRGPAQHCDAV